MNESSKVILDVNDLGVEFSVEGEWIPAAKNLTYQIRAGEVLAIVGESGGIGSPWVENAGDRFATAQGYLALEGKNYLSLLGR